MLDYCSINTFCFNVWHYFLKVEIADFLFIADFEHTAGRRNNFVNRTNAMIRYDLLQKNIFNQRTYFSGYFSKFKCISLNLEHTVIVFPTYFVNILNIYFFFLFEIKKLSVDTTYTNNSGLFVDSAVKRKSLFTGLKKREEKSFSFINHKIIKKNN